MYECMFNGWDGKLNIRVNNDATYGTIDYAVLDSLSEENKRKIQIGDSIIAVNGAPLGAVTDHKELAEKLNIKKSSRPVKITFMMSAQHRVDDMIAQETSPIRRGQTVSTTRSSCSSSSRPATTEWGRR